MNDRERMDVASLLPEIPDFEKPFWDGLQNGVLMIQKCSACGNTQFPPSSVCTKCLASDVEWVPYTGKATLWSKVRFHKGYLKPYMDTPYSVALAKLDEGSIVTARLPEEYGEMPIDTPVAFKFVTTADGTNVIECVPENG